MAIPTITRAWTISGNNRYTYVTVLSAMQNFALSMKNFLKTTMGYTVKGSCTAGTGAMDGVDRWSVSTDVTPQGANPTSSQAWFVLTDGNGVDILLAFQGGSFDVFRFSFSPSGSYVAAGTANNQPTATDECLIVSGQTIVNASTSMDRVWHMWGSSDKKMCRFALFRNGVLITFWGVEQCMSTVQPPATFSPPVWGYFWNSLTMGVFSGSLMAGGGSPNGGVCKVHTSLDVFPVLGGGGEGFGAVGGSTGSFYNVEKPELQGSNGEILVPLTITSITTNAEGKLGNRIDWWAAITGTTTTTPSNGDTFANLSMIAIGQAVLPWDGATIPVVN